MNGYTFRYKQNPDGTYGVDYFDPNGQPITNTQFAAGSGQDTNTIEQQANATSLDTQTQQDEFQRAAQTGNNPFGDRSLLGSATQNYIATGDTSGTTGTSGTTTTTSGSTYQPNLVEYPQGSGYQYDLNDPAQKQAFYNRRLTDLQHSRDQQIAGIDQNIADLVGSSKDYVTNYFKQLDAFGQAKGAGDTNRIDAYSQASPNVFQSSEATSYNSANNNYLKGIGDAVQQANTAVGANYLANPNDPSQLGADTTYGRQQQNYFAGKNDTNQQYNDIYAGLQQQNDPSTNPYRFNYQAAGLQAPAAVNMSGYTPSVGFNQIASSATPGAGFQPAGMGAFNGQTPLNNFLGNTKLDQQSTDFLRNYLLGKA